jgi:dTDP-glucose pyrophosphorylase
MPMAGAGSRFSATGESRPKPLIEVFEVPMAIWALRSVTSVWPECRVVFVLLKEHENQFGISGVISRYLPSARFTFASSLTGGSLQTALLAREMIEGGPLLVVDCDLAFRSNEFNSLIDNMIDRRGQERGALLSFSSKDPRYSYARVQDGCVISTAEKCAISEHALVGAYAFREAAEFFELGNAIVVENARVANGEFYISEVYNRLIRKGGIVRLAGVDSYWSFGTPEELTACRQSSDFVAFLGSLGDPLS